MFEYGPNGGARFGRNRYSQQEHEFFLDMVRKRTAMAAAAGALVKFKEKQLDEVNRVQDNYIYFLSNIRQFYVRGGAGTGKTWIALKLANSEAENGGKVLLTCKSLALASTLKGMAGESVDVVDLDTLRSKGVKGQYDAIFVDEAQDFSEEDAFNLKLFLKDEKQSRLGVFYDDVQKVRAGTFGDAFMIEISPFLLHENIRNTANIYKYATSETELGQDVITNPVEGPTPKSENIAGNKKLAQRLNNLLKEYLVDEKLQTSSMVILVDDLDEFNGLFPDGIAKWKFVEHPCQTEEEIRVSTVEAFKGLESDMIIYIRKNDVSQNLNYIAYTRAKYYLIELVVK